MNAHVNFEMNRRDFFSRFALGLGGLALTGLFRRSVAGEVPDPFAGVLAAPHLTPRAKRIIYLFMSGGPSQLDLFDYKPTLNKMNGEDLPESILELSSQNLPATNYQTAVNEMKKGLILKTLEQTGGSYTEAAKLLGLHPTNLHRLIRTLNIKSLLK